MRFLRVIASLNPVHGGPVEGLLRSAAILSAAGHETEVAVLDRPDAPWLGAVPLPAHPLGHVARRFGYSPRLQPWLRANAGRFDGVIVHGLWDYTSVGTWRALKGASTPYLVFTHGMLDPWFDQVQPIKRRLRRAYWTWLQRPALRDAAAVLFTTEEERALAHTAYPGDYRARVVSYGAQDGADATGRAGERFLEAHPALRGRRFLLFLSRIHPKKGCDLLINAFARIASQEPDLDLVIAGPDQVGWRATLEQMADKAGVASRVHWPGMLQGVDKWGAYHACEAFVLPSHQENFGIVVAEALSCAKPVLLTNQVNIAREVVQGGAGLAVADDQPGVDALLQSFARLRPLERTQMGAAARRLFLRRFDIRRAALDLVEAVAEARAAT